MRGTHIKRKAPRLTSWNRVLLNAWCGLVLLFLAAPIAVVFPISFSSSEYLQFPPPGWSLRWYQAFLGDPQWLDATLRSFRIASVTMLLATPLGTLLSFCLVRGKFQGRALIGQMTLLPMVVPLIIYSIAVYGLFAQLRLIGSWFAIVLGHTVYTIPYVVVIMTAALNTFDESQERAAMSLGASRWTAVMRITFPQLWPSIVSAAFLAFISSFDELVIAMFLGGSNMTLPKKMFDNILNEIDPTIAAVSVLQIVMVSAVLVLVSRFGAGAAPKT